MARMKPGGVSVKDETTYTERREKVARLYLEGKTQNELAALLGVNQSTISRDLDAIRQQWQEQALMHFDEIKARELARIDRLEVEYWEAWQESKKDAETVTQKAKDDGKKEAIKVSRGQTGNPAFLNGVQWCIEQRLKIFGVYEAIKIRAIDWQDEIVDALKRGELTADQVRIAYPDSWADFFRKAGVDAAN